MGKDRCWDVALLSSRSQNGLWFYKDKHHYRSSFPNLKIKSVQKSKFSRYWNHTGRNANTRPPSWDVQALTAPYKVALCSFMRYVGNGKRVCVSTWVSLSNTCPICASYKIKCYKRIPLLLLHMVLMLWGHFWFWMMSTQWKGVNLLSDLLPQNFKVQVGPQRFRKMTWWPSEASDNFLFHTLPLVLDKDAGCLS